jgi:selenocysteine lyase/cysteine desulfurase
MLTRRAFLQTTRAAGTAAFAATMFRDDSLAHLHAAELAVQHDSASKTASNEDYWREVQEAFTLDRTIINLNNGGCCPSPRVVHEALKRYLDISNQAPVYHMWQILEPNIETVRRRLAAEFGCNPEEIAITRSASEALQIAQLGIPLRAGDEVVTTNQDYGRMLDTWDQRVRRDGIKLKKISFPVPPKSLDDLADRLLGAVTPATKVLHFCHITNLTGQIFPVRRICDEARRRGIKTIVDGAHAFAHFPYKCSDLGCDFYGTSLHKWLLAPIGTGFLYVRRENISSLWPLTPAAAEKSGDIRKFEEIGTHPAANHNAIAEALAFHQGIGIERKAARLRYLRDRWAKRLAANPNVRIHTNLDPAHSCAIGTVQVQGVATPKVIERLWTRWRVIATPIVHAEYEGARITPNIYTTLDEIDTFASAMEEIAAKGIDG